jgi:hypothetical protein
MAEGPSTTHPSVSPLATGRVSWFALAALLLFATTLAEFLTGSTFVPVALLHPLGLAQLAGLYGGGALAIREVTVRWNKRWASVLLLGGLFCLVEEGLGARTLFDPTGSVLGPSALLSHWLGVNWVPFVALSLFHAVFSISLPILLVELLFPATRGKRLVRNGALAGAIAACGLAGTTMALAEPYLPGWPVIAFAGVLGLSYVVAAYIVPRDLLSPRSPYPEGPEWLFFGVGFIFVAEVYTLLIFGPGRIPAQDLIALFLASAAFFLFLVVRFAGHVNTEVRKIDFALGMVAFLIPIDVIEELSGDVGVLAVTGLAMALLLYLRRKWTGAHLRSPTLSTQPA